ncbi:hypothetical protein OsJ_26475 [Oryza sativa Japonica Group]|uniref:BTB domain-containing protein n=1 Tax=Oryza sativa subsp. japonica TaxID=39947 RepID=B9FZP4_ORYSJ|nr:hypothetical protein OsJ_26475 [Oryza sativa Japonica Group]
MGSKKRMSRYAKKHEEATLKFDVVGYSLNEGMAAGEFIRSPAFAVGATTGQSASTPTAPRLRRTRACSPVFKAELYGGMKEREARSVTVDDTQPDVFRALPHFMYTDSLPDMDGVEDADYVEMIRLLLVAADRYAMDRMKLLCESVLDDLLDAETVGTTLALADQHSCNNLKDVCVKFMATSKGMDAVMATEGYDNLKRNCPYVLIDVLEKA